MPIEFTPHRRAIPVPPPPTVTSASHGLSLLGTDVVLGGELTAGAPLVNDREIVTGGFHLTFLFDDSGFSDRLDINEFELLWTAAAGSPVTEILAGQIGIFGDNVTVQFIGTSSQNTFTLQNTGTAFEIIGAGGFGNPHFIFRNDNVLKGNFEIPGAFSTGDPGSGIAPWKLGTVVAAAVALDATRYVEVDINGVVVKLGIVV